jgi:hypothetical protein
MASQLAEYAAMYSASVVLRAILNYFLLFHEFMAKTKLKQHHELIFMSEELLAQFESI